MRVDVSQAEPAEIDADLLVVGLYEDGSLPAALADAPGAGDAKGGFKKLSDAAPRGPAGAGRRARQARGVRRRAGPRRGGAGGETGRLAGGRLARLAAARADDEAAIAEGLVTGTILGAYRFDRFLSRDPEDPPPPTLESLTLIAPAALAGAAETARVCAEAQNRARDLQSLPSNVATPTFLAARAEEIAAAHDSVSAEVLGPEEIAAKEMGGLVAVSQGGAEEPRLIVLRYAAAARARPWAWSARASPSTPAASRSSPRPGCTR